MKKYNIFWVGFGILLFGAVNVYATEKTGHTEMEAGEMNYQIILENFKDNEKKCEYSDIIWKDSLEEIEKKFGDKVVECNKMERNFLGNEYRYLKHTEIHELDGQKAEMYFEFLNDELQAVRYDFSLEGDYETWFQKQIKTLVDLYGDDYILKEMENEELALQDTFYKWEYKDNSVCAFLITGDTIDPMATIGITMSE